MTDPDPDFVASMPPLEQWTIYDHPADYPDHYVARLFHIHKGSVEATGNMRLSNHPQALRLALFEEGFIRMNRSPDDHPSVLETWI